jgi:hypothetical protein
MLLISARKQPFGGKDGTATKSAQRTFAARHIKVCNADKAVIHNWILNDCFQFPSIEADYSAAIASSVSPNPRGTAKSGRLAARFCNARPITTRLISVVPSTIRSI